MLAWKTNSNVLLVKNMLGYKNIKNIMRYIGKIHFKEEDYETTYATTLDEILALGKSGWTKYNELNLNGQQVHFYKKPKRFSAV